MNGQKIWATGAQFCDWGILLARHDPAAAKHAGLTFFVIDIERDARCHFSGAVAFFWSDTEFLFEGIRDIWFEFFGTG